MIRASIFASSLNAWDIVVFINETMYEFGQGGRNEILDDANAFLGAGLDVCGHVHLQRGKVKSDLSQIAK